jgi:hypothetical protein
MAGPGSNTAVEDGLLKTVYEDRIAEGVLNKFPLKDAFKVKDSPWNGGRGLEWSAHIERNQSPMAVGEDSALPVADNQKYVTGFITQRKIAARWRTTDEQLKDTQSREGAYRSTRTENMERLIDDIAYREEFYLGTDGRGVFALLDSGSSGTTLELDAPGGVTGNDFGNRFIKKGMYLAAINPANGAIRANTPQVTAVNADGSNITVSADPSWTENDYIVQAANGSVTDVQDTAYEKAPWGLTALFDDGTYRANYYGVSRTTYPNYASYVSASTRALSFDLLQRVSDIVNQKLGGEISDIWCHHSVRRVYLTLTEADRRYADEPARMNPDGGTKAFKQGDVTMGSVAVKALRTAPFATMFLVDRAGCDCVRYTSDKGSWVAGTSGEILVRDGTGTNAKHAWEAWYVKRYNLFVRNPGKAARLDGLTGQTLVIVRGE